LENRYLKNKYFCGGGWKLRLALGLLFFLLFLVPWYLSLTALPALFDVDFV